MMLTDLESQKMCRQSYRLQTQQVWISSTTQHVMPLTTLYLNIEKSSMKKGTVHKMQTKRVPLQTISGT